MGCAGAPPTLLLVRDPVGEVDPHPACGHPLPLRGRGLASPGFARIKNRPCHFRGGRGDLKRIPAMTDFRARGTIIGPTGLTAVFGMGTGGTPPVWSPEKPPAGGQAGPVANLGGSVAIWQVRLVRSLRHTRASTPSRHVLKDRLGCATPFGSRPALGTPSGRLWDEADGSGWSSHWLLGPVGCGGHPPSTAGLSTWSSSRSLRS